MSDAADILAHLDAIDALAAKATEGPWEERKETITRGIQTKGKEKTACLAAPNRKLALGVNYCTCPEGDVWQSWLMATPETLTFIAASRDGWPATVKALRVAVERMNSTLATWDSPRLDSDNMIRFVGVEMENMRDDLAAVRSLLKGEQP